MVKKSDEKKTKDNEFEVLRVTSAGKKVYNPETKEVLIIPHES